MNSDEEFKGLTKLLRLNLNEGLTSIGADAFKGCTSLTSVTILGNPTIGDGAFRYGVTVTYGNE